MTVKVTKPEINVREKISELDKPSGVAGQAMLAAETPQEQFNLIGAGRRNLLYNGEMRVHQRGDLTGITSSAYTLDRWKLGDGTNGTFSVSQSTNVPNGFKNSALVNVTTADTDLASATQYLNFYQPLEGQDLRQLAYGTPDAKDLTLSFWVRSSKVGQFASELEIPGAKVNVQTWTVNQEDTWEYKTVKFEGNTSTAITTTTSTGMWVAMWIAAGAGISGPSFQSGWRTLNQTERLPEGIPNMADSTSNNIRFTGVQMEVGKVATPFEHRSYGEELALCQRYYYKLGGVGGTDTATSLSSGSMYTSTNVNLYVPFPVPMRASPGISKTVNGTGNWLNLYVGATGTVGNPTPQVGDNGTDSARVYIPSAHSGNSPSAAGAGVWAILLSGASLNFSAEL